MRIMRKALETSGVGGGIRTLGHRNHNPALYQLSYTHRVDVLIVSSSRRTRQTRRH
jgi:hypothetical protein